MTREEAIKHLGTYSSTLGSGQTSQEQHEEAKRVAIENLEKTRWIPVTEGLPEEDGGYLVTVKRGYVTTALWFGSAEKWKEITAWMPLPEPYEEDKECEGKE